MQTRQPPGAAHQQKSKQLTFKSILFESQNSTPVFIDIKLLEITKKKKLLKFQLKTHR